MSRRVRAAWQVGLWAAALSAGGCGGYTLQGRAIAGGSSDMAFVADHDPRFDETGVSGVRIIVERDPKSLGSEVVATGLTDIDGRFSIPIGEFGAGWMVEEWRLSAVKPGYQTSRTQVSLQGTSKLRLLVIMLPGISDHRPRENLMDDYERFR